MLVKCVSDNNGSNNDLIKIWDDLGFSIEMFYGNITMFNLNSICDDYFAIFSLISNIKAIPIDQRKNLLNKIALTGSFFQINARYIEMAWSVYECNSELVPPHKKIFWCAMFFAGKVPEYCPDDNDVSEMIRVAIGLIQEARSDRSRCVDEDLVKKLYEANGISA